MNATLAVGLRFRKSQARVLRAAHARALANGDEGARVLAGAAEAAAKGEPIICWCDDPSEAQAMADAFTKFDVVAPTLEQVILR